MARLSADKARRRARRLIESLKRGELGGLHELSDIFHAHPPDVEHADADLAVHALGRCFEAPFLSSAGAPTERDRSLVWLGIYVAWQLMYVRVTIDAPLAERGIAQMLRACDEHWEALATLGCADERVALVDARGTVARFACVISTRLVNFAALGDIMPRLVPKLLAVAAELLDGAEMIVWPGVLGLGEENARLKREQSALRALAAALRTTRLFVMHEPARAALCTPVAMAALGRIIKELGDWASRPASLDEPITIEHAGFASELVDILRCLAAADGGAKRLMRIGAMQPLAAILRAPFSVPPCAPRAIGKVESRPSLREHAAAALTPCARLTGSTGCAARAELWAERVPHAALRLIKANDSSLTDEIPAAFHMRELARGALLAHAVLTDVTGTASALESLHGAGAEAALAALRDDTLFAARRRERPMAAAVPFDASFARGWGQRMIEAIPTLFPADDQALGTTLLACVLDADFAAPFNKIVHEIWAWQRPED
ncbi:hypothetical protein KFE25_008076 [Diacronema lutheri]|uniref:Uncharacterized protein n=1 Tax=Diacronema lutheri TaxID=2081491 RepID=A0A8J5XQS9_DIALT|nr:hypothetical protein KFE25_008076 [Diacronema lutheri]